MSWGNHLVKQPENGVSLATSSWEHELSPILYESSVITLNHCELALPPKQLFLSCLASSCPIPAFQSNISTAAWQNREGIWARFKLPWWKPTTVSYGGPKALRKALLEQNLTGCFQVYCSTAFSMPVRTRYFYSSSKYQSFCKTCSGSQLSLFQILHHHADFRALGQIWFSVTTCNSPGSSGLVLISLELHNCAADGRLCPSSTAFTWMTAATLG